MERICGRCGQCKPVDEFAWRRRARGQRDNYCRPCRAACKQDHYSRNRQRYIDEAQRRRRALVADRTAELLQFLLSHPCADCGEADPLGLEFDHVGDKSFSVSKGLRYHSWPAVMAEIAKCDVV